MAQLNHDNTLLIATLSDLSIPHFLSSAIIKAAQNTKSRLVITLISNHFSDDNSHTRTWHAVQRILTFAYVQATKVAYDMDNVLMHFDVLLKATNDILPSQLLNDFQHYYTLTGGVYFISE